jgi:hypothetical protein
LSVIGNRSGRPLSKPVLCLGPRGRLLDQEKARGFHQAQERTTKLLKQAEYMAATGLTLHPTIAFRSGLGPYMAQVSDNECISPLL